MTTSPKWMSRSKRSKGEVRVVLGKPKRTELWKQMRSSAVWSELGDLEEGGDQAAISKQIHNKKIRISDLDIVILIIKTYF